MKRKTKQDVPKTIGELRRRLAKLGNPWEVDSKLNDNDPLPDPPRGGQREEEIPEEHRLVSLEPSIDLIGLIAVQLPTNPFLRLRWVEAKLLNPNEVEGLALELGEDKGGTA